MLTKELWRLVEVAMTEILGYALRMTFGGARLVIALRLRMKLCVRRAILML
jgi:hypothetical protein